jgi:hypothetical protein
MGEMRNSYTILAENLKGEETGTLLRRIIETDFVKYGLRA